MNTAYKIQKAAIISSQLGCSTAVLCSKVGAGHTQSRMIRMFCSVPEYAMGEVREGVMCTTSTDNQLGRQYTYLHISRAVCSFTVELRMRALGGFCARRVQRHVLCVTLHLWLNCIVYISYILRSIDAKTVTGQGLSSTRASDT